MKNMDLKNKLLTSIIEEDKSLDQRFERAGKIFDQELQLRDDKNEVEINEKQIEKMVGKTYTMAKDEVDWIESVIFEFAAQGILVNRSEIIRMGLLSFKELGTDRFSMINRIRFKNY